MPDSLHSPMKQASDAIPPRARRVKHTWSEVRQKTQSALRMLEIGLPHHEVAQVLGVSRATLYRWQKRCGALKWQSLDRLVAENAELRRRLKDLEHRS